jgi:hypothetical protein
VLPPFLFSQVSSLRNACQVDIQLQKCRVPPKKPQREIDQFLQQNSKIVINAAIFLNAVLLLQEKEKKKSAEEEEGSEEEDEEEEQEQEQEVIVKWH